MSDRRSVLKQIALLSGSALPLCQPGSAWAAPAPTGTTGAAAVRAIARRDETLLKLGGIGDGYKMSWGLSDQQYVAVNDGPGWGSSEGVFFNTRLWTVEGEPQQAVFREVPGYPELDRNAQPEGTPHFYGHGVLAIEGRLYQFLSTLDRAEHRPRHWQGAKLIYSDDGGLTWRNQNGTAPVVWEGWKQQSRKRFVFFNEPDGCFSLLSILQMGQGYRANRDGHVYVYGLNGNVDGRMNELVMFRVATEKILDRTAYEFFGGLQADGAARWVRHIAGRKPVHRFPRGWVNHKNLFPGDLVVESWLPSVVYNEPLGLYMMSSAGIGCAPDGTEFGKPSYLGFWVSENPWGPWRQVHEDTAWTPGGDPAARAYAPQIAPKWVSQDGRSLWLVWADLKGIREFGRDEALMEAALKKAKTPQQRNAIEVDFIRRYMPGFSFSTQRVDLILD